MSAAPKQLDLSAPPIVKTIGQRALIVGVVFSLGAIALAFTRPEEFYRGYLLGYMDWLGIALGSMAIVMIRHLTGGGWGTVIRRILGAAMRTLPVLAILFIPDYHRGPPAPDVSLAQAARRDHRSAHPRTSSQERVHQRRLSQQHRLHHPRHHLHRDLEPALVPALACGRSRPTSPARPTTRRNSKPSPDPASFSTASPSLSPPSTGSCRSIPAGSQPSTA